MTFSCHIQQKKRSKIGRFFKTHKLNQVVDIDAIDETHAKLIILKRFGLFTKIFNIFEKTK